MLKFDYENDSTIYLSDNYDLKINGHGFLAIANNGLDIYLQSRSTHVLIKSSTIGETAIITMDTIYTNWQPCGITHQSNTDSLVSIYRNVNTLYQYRARNLAQDLSFSSGKDIIFKLDFIDTTYHGIYSVANKGAFFYMLGMDTTQNDYDKALDNLIRNLHIFLESDSLYPRYRWGSGIPSFSQIP